MRGIRSHGLARVPYFADRLDRGIIVADPEMRFTRGSDTTGLLDAHDGIGIVASNEAMRSAMSMAASHGSGFVVVKDSSHFGYAGYWAELARSKGYIGISLSNSGGRVAPTFGREPLLGTNPLSVAIPGGETDFVLDMATSTVAVGKVETALREQRSIPTGWVISEGAPELDGKGVLTFDSALIPLGGVDTDQGGHKGYGLSLMVELLCGALAGTSLDARVAGAAGEGRPAIGHFMGAIRVDGFRDPVDVRSEMDATFHRIRSSEKAPGEDRIFIQGEPEALSVQQTLRDGIVVTPMVRDGLDRWAERLGLGSIVG